MLEPFQNLKIKADQLIHSRTMAEILSCKKSVSNYILLMDLVDIQVDVSVIWCPILCVDKNQPVGQLDSRCTVFRIICRVVFCIRGTWVFWNFEIILWMVLFIWLEQRSVHSAMENYKCTEQKVMQMQLFSFVHRRLHRWACNCIRNPFRNANSGTSMRSPYAHTFMAEIERRVSFDRFYRSVSCVRRSGKSFLYGISAQLLW